MLSGLDCLAMLRCRFELIQRANNSSENTHQRHTHIHICRVAWIVDPNDMKYEKNRVARFYRLVLPVFTFLPFCAPTFLVLYRSRVVCFCRFALI